MNLQERNNLWATVERRIRQYMQCETVRLRNSIIKLWEQFPESEDREWTVDEIREAVEQSNTKRARDKEKVLFEPIDS